MKLYDNKDISESKKELFDLFNYVLLKIDDYKIKDIAQLCTKPKF